MQIIFSIFRMNDFDKCIKCSFFSTQAEYAKELVGTTNFASSHVQAPVSYVGYRLCFIEIALTLLQRPLRPLALGDVH